MAQQRSANEVEIIWQTMRVFGMDPLSDRDFTFIEAALKDLEQFSMEPEERLIRGVYEGAILKKQAAIRAEREHAEQVTGYRPTPADYLREALALPDFDPGYEVQPIEGVTDSRALLASELDPKARVKYAPKHKPPEQQAGELLQQALSEGETTDPRKLIELGVQVGPPKLRDIGG